MNQVERFLKTQELYDAIIALIPEHTIDRVGETAVRGKLDAILSMGKIEGRLTALDEKLRQPVVGEVWRNRIAPDDTVEIYAIQDDGTIAYRHANPSCAPGYYAAMGRVSRRSWQSFRPLYEPVTPQCDRLIEDWMKIVESD